MTQVRNIGTTQTLPIMKDTSTPANQRQVLEQALYVLTEATMTTFATAVAIERQLLGTQPSKPEMGEEKDMDTQPMLTGFILWLERINLMVQATNAILQHTEKEVTK